MSNIAYPERAELRWQSGGGKGYTDGADCI
jgi:hypothetical protein